MCIRLNEDFQQSRKQTNIEFVRKKLKLKEIIHYSLWPGFSF